jgi:hypothetical protein
MIISLMATITFVHLGRFPDSHDEQDGNQDDDEYRRKIDQRTGWQPGSGRSVRRGFTNMPWAIGVSSADPVEAR